MLYRIPPVSPTPLPTNHSTDFVARSVYIYYNSFSFSYPNLCLIACPLCLLLPLSHPHNENKRIILFYSALDSKGGTMKELDYFGTMQGNTGSNGKTGCKIKETITRNEYYEWRYANWKINLRFLWPGMPWLFVVDKSGPAALKVSMGVEKEIGLFSYRICYAKVNALEKKLRGFPHLFRSPFLSIAILSKCRIHPGCHGVDTHCQRFRSSS